jgi:hypothetical protein
MVKTPARLDGLDGLRAEPSLATADLANGFDFVAASIVFHDLI